MVLYILRGSKYTLVNFLKMSSASTCVTKIYGKCSLRINAYNQMNAGASYVNWCQTSFGENFSEWSTVIQLFVLNVKNFILTL